MAFKETLKNRPFLIVALTYAMIDFCFGLTMMILPLYAKFVLHLDEGLVGIGAAGVAIGILASVPLWMWIYSNKGPKYGLLTGMIIFAAGIWPIFLLEDVVLLIIITIIPGIGVCGMLMTEPSISAAIDYDELKTSKRREATYNGVLAFVARLSMVLSGITLIIMQLATGLDVNASSQSPTAIFGLKLLVGIIPLAGILLGIVIFRFFPINYTEFVKMQEKLEVMHQERVEKFKSQQK